MRDYEAMVVLNPSLEEDKLETAIGKIEKLIKKNKNKVEKVDKWGKRKLSYPIKRFDEGYYLVFYFKGEEESIKELNRVLQIADEVIRHRIIKRSG